MSVDKQSKDKSRSGAPDWLTTPIEFEEQRGFRVSRNTMRIVVVVAIGTLVWAALAPIRELARAQGQLIPISQVRPVQHLEGGIVDQILMEEGQVVEQGQPLIRLQTVIAESELAVTRARVHSLLLQKESVEALLAGRDADFTRFGQWISATQISENHRNFRLRFDHRSKEHELLLARIGQRNSEIAGLEKDVVNQRTFVDVPKEHLAMRQTLAAVGNASKRQLLESQLLYEQAIALVMTTEGRLATTREALSEAKATLIETEARAHKLWSEDLLKASSELEEAQEQIKKLEDRVDRLVVRAPTRGRVQNVLQRSPGEVVRAGETIARIVPLGDALVAEVFVKPEDVAAVRVGDRTELKVTAYDFSKYGKIKGEVTAISPTTTERDDKRSYYKVIVQFNSGRSDRYMAEWQLQPGMTVDAEIISGSKTLLQYLLKPIYRGIDSAFSER